MGYYDILEFLKKQIEEIENEEEYIKHRKELALKTKDIALELELNVRSVRNAIHKMLKQEEIECLQGDNNQSEKYYIIKLEKVKKDENTTHINISLDVNRTIEHNNLTMDNKKET